MSSHIDFGQWGKYHTTLANLYKDDSRHLILGKRSCRGTEFALGSTPAEQIDTINALIWSLERVRREIQQL